MTSFPDWDEQAFKDQLAENLKGRVYRLLLVSDMFHDEMKKMIDFVNETSDPWEVFGVEIKRFDLGNGQGVVVTTDWLSPPPAVLEQKIASAEFKARSIMNVIKSDAAVLSSLDFSKSKITGGRGENRTSLGMKIGFSPTTLEAIWVGYFFKDGQTDGFHARSGQLCMKVVLPAKGLATNPLMAKLTSAGYVPGDEGRVLGKTLHIAFDGETQQVLNIDDVRDALAELAGVLP